MRRSIRMLIACSLFAAPAAAATPGVSAELEMSSTTSPKEKVDFARTAIDEMSASVKTVEKLLEQAEKDKNVEHVDCLQRKLTPMRALLEVSKASNTSMQQSLAASEIARADQEFRKVAVALTKSRDFLAEAQGCVGDSGVKRGDASIAITETTEALAQTPDSDIETEGPRISQN
jgi:hypothetical protein